MASTATTTTTTSPPPPAAAAMRAQKIGTATKMNTTSFALV